MTPFWIFVGIAGVLVVHAALVGRENRKAVPCQRRTAEMRLRYLEASMMMGRSRERLLENRYAMASTKERGCLLCEDYEAVKLLQNEEWRLFYLSIDGEE